MTSLRDAHKSRTRRAIEDAAWALFAERGYDGVTLAEVAEAAGVGLRTVFRYFPRKDLLLDGDEVEMRAAVAAALAVVPTGTPLSVMLRHAAREAVCARSLDCERERLRAALARTTPAIAARELTRDAERTALLASELTRRLGAGPEDLRPAVLAGAVTGAIRGAQQRWLERPDLDPAALVDEALEMLAAALDGAAGSRAPAGVPPAA